MTTPFNKPFMIGKELFYIADAHFNGRLAGDGPYTQRCHTWLENRYGVGKALLTHSCTAALEMAALLLDIKPGDEVIMPSYTFVSTANAFVLRGGVPVFADIRPDTLNIDENILEELVTEKTKAIVPVHYAGVSCEMDSIMETASRHDLAVIEDAAQGVESTYKGKPLGSIGTFGAYSFHETKNVISGEGGALLVNDERYELNAEIIREKGTDRSQFFRGQVDKYTWQEVGSSFLPGELIAAFLWAQLESVDHIKEKRLNSWNVYHSLLEESEKQGKLRRPVIPSECAHNGHMYYLLFDNIQTRTRIIEKLKARNIHSVFHYIPLHSSPAGERYCRTGGDMAVTDRVADTLLRLPLWVGIEKSVQEEIVATILEEI